MDCGFILILSDFKLSSIAFKNWMIEYKFEVIFVTIYNKSIRLCHNKMFSHEINYDKFKIKIFKIVTKSYVLILFGNKL